MKTLRAPLALVLFAGSLAYAQAPMPVAGPVPGNAATAPAMVRSAEELDQLLGPIALYPDALIAIILPASTAPADIVLAARQVRENPNDLSQTDHRAWDDSIKSLTNYPEVLQWMDENLQWTKQLGEAFVAQSADVMQSIQRLRAKAQSVGTLTNTPQQQIIAEADAIRIVPAQPDVIYVPSYDPQVVFVDRPVYYSRPYISFGAGVAVGSWLAYDCDWRGRTIWVGDRHRAWVRPDWHRPLVVGPTYSGPRFTQSANVHAWRPSPRTVVNINIAARSAPPRIVRPAPFHAGPSNFAARPATPESRRAPSRPVAAPAMVDNSPRPAPTAPVANPPSVRRDGSRFAARSNTPAPVPQPQVVAPPTGPISPSTAPVAPPSGVTPPPLQRRSGIDWSHDNNNNNGNNVHPRSSPRRPETAYAPAPAPAPSGIVPPANPGPRTFNHVRGAPAPAPAAIPQQAAPAPQQAPNQPAASSPPQNSNGHHNGRRNENER